MKNGTVCLEFGTEYHAKSALYDITHAVSYLEITPSIISNESFEKRYRIRGKEGNPSVPIVEYNEETERWDLIIPIFENKKNEYILDEHSQKCVELDGVDERGAT
jgi:hypothetical protein